VAQSARLTPARRWQVSASVAVFLLLSVHATAAPGWTRLRSAHFVIVGEVGERDLRRVAERLEGFREALRRALPNATVASPVPTTIIVFASDRAFTPFKMLVDGRPMERLGGYFQAGEDANHIALSFQWGSRAYPIVFHEYTHALLSATVRSVPAWLEEGLAEVYSTFQERDGGRTAVIGMPPEEHVAEIRNSSLLPLDELMAVDHTSPVYNEGTRRGMFYAESWALTHYLLFGNPERHDQLPAYLSLLDQGHSVAESFRQAFKAEPRTLEAELRGYVKRFVLDGVTLQFDHPFTSAEPIEAAAITDAEAQAYTAELLARQMRTDAALAQIRRALDAEPGSARALAALGRFHLRANRLDEALPLLQRAARAMPGDGAIAATYARALVDEIRRFGPLNPDEANLARTRGALARAAALDPEDAYVTAMQGYIELLDGSRLDEAQAFLERATARAPMREEYQLLLAQVVIERQDLERGQTLLGPLAARGSTPEVRKSAQEMLERLEASDAASTNADPPR
jgi:tetratricopeptide (TPR) repeat protein